MRALLVFAVLVGCVSTPPPPPPPGFEGMPFRYSVILEGVGCTEFYSSDPARALENQKRYTRPNDINLEFNPTKACDSLGAWALCTQSLKGAAVLSYLYKKSSRRQTDYHCRESGGKFTKLR